MTIDINEARKLAEKIECQHTEGGYSLAGVAGDIRALCDRVEEAERIMREIEDGGQSTSHSKCPSCGGLLGWDGGRQHLEHCKLAAWLKGGKA